jgi:hypothetical protein
MLWAIIYWIYFYRLHISRNLKSSCTQIRFSDDKFQALINDRWIDVTLADNSIVSYWLLALQWKQVEKNSRYFQKKYSTLLFPSSLEETEFKDLFSLL